MEENCQSKTYFELADLVEQQGQVIKSQSETIAKLLNENVEKENLINELMKGSILN
ncbi:hypothetical protein EV207_101170 [Scopulibacillus darangshiensis]|uniref:Uncharacterized protein n=1 Tax=Scopulibacillus darangshiensis TaxID=442528 RepID=A0A4R2PB12_9BACL|nr:hypothetical protein [Scopulibacillus darangshiensis]TCP32192.1 hypothetical protein EV207_101170 [Scopulibacillus darangshiensis]